VSDSYPTIQDSLSDMQKEFMGCVEMHLDPPEVTTGEYMVEAAYRHDEDEASLPGNVVRFAIAVDGGAHDVEERSHTIDFLSVADGGVSRRLGRIRHSMKRVEAWQGTHFWTESRFEVDAPDVPHERAREAEVEVEVRLYVERLKQLDDGRRLVPA